MLSASVFPRSLECGRRRSGPPRPPDSAAPPPTLMPPQNLSLTDFNEKLLTLSREVESRNDMLGVLEAQLFEQAVKKKLMPTMLPVAAPYNASGFGKRIDPFNGQWTMHEGIDFLADAGSPVVSAAAGVVQFAGFHPQYGYVIDIDHGNDLVTRYAHLSKLFVKEGEVLQRGRRIALTGNTGRSPGPGRDKIVYFSGVVTPCPRVHEDHRLPPQAPRGSLEHPDAAVRQP